MSDSLTIRPLTSADIEPIATWVAETPLWQHYNVTASGFAERLTNGLKNGATIFVAERANQVLGFLWLVERGAFNRSAYVQLIGVRPDERSSGVGRSLMQFAETHTTSQDIFLLVSDFNTDAQRFYQRIGYSQVGKIDNYVIAGTSELVYRKQIKH
jgi:ribosomal protein S18 acetylase RimI-like enzyme